MPWILKNLSAIVALCFVCDTTYAQAVATQFVYPVGNMYSPPTEQAGNPNGYKISQGFNTPRNYVNGGANDAWCADSSFVQKAPTNESTCVSQGYQWVYGHTGVDLSNGGCGGTIKATANGIVEFSGSYAGYGNLLKIKHILPNGKVIHSLYGHRQSVSMTQGQTVVMGQAVGNVGSTGAGGNCHVHFAIYADEMPPTTPVGYLYNDDGFTTSGGTIVQPNIMRYFLDPLLFVDDRNNEYATGLACCNLMAPIFPSFGATTKTAYVTDGAGTTLSLQRAVIAGWLDQYLYEKHSDGLWYYSPAKTNLDEYVFDAGVTYGLIAKKQGLAFHYLKPGNHYLDARARQDMVAFVQMNSVFGHALRATYGKDPNWAPPYGINWMSFMYNGSQSTWVNQAYSTVNPLIRFGTLRDPQTGQWAPWKQLY